MRDTFQIHTHNSYPQMSTDQTFLERIIDILFPKRCAGCREIGSFLCARCIQSFPPATTPPETFISALFDYRYPAVKRSIWKLKYENVRGIAEPLGEILYEHIISDLEEKLIVSRNEKLLLVPIPLHHSRFRERGYNQSELIADTLIANDTNNLFVLSPQSLIRDHKTPPQAKKESRTERLKNLRGAFLPNSKQVYRKNVILIDDVSTTGATLREARKALLRAGARSVIAYTIAH